MPGTDTPRLFLGAFSKNKKVCGGLIYLLTKVITYQFLESLLSSFIGLKWIKHKKYIETQIGYLKEEIESEQIDEILRG